jgi:hypothetical protein
MGDVPSTTLDFNDPNAWTNYEASVRAAASKYPENDINGQ